MPYCSRYGGRVLTKGTTQDSFTRDRARPSNQDYFSDDRGQASYLFGDGAYPLSPWWMMPVEGNLGEAERGFSKAFRTVSVEKGIGWVSTLWPFGV